MRTVTIGPAPSLAAGQTNDGSRLADLARDYRLETVAHFQAPTAALAFVQAATEAPEAVVADVSTLHDPAMDGALIRLLDAAALRWPDCRVAVVLGEAQRYLQPQIQHANARTFRPGQLDDLAAYLNLPIRQEVQARIVLVLSAKGGVGKTTLVANLAAALVARHGLRVAVVDGDLTRGDLARLLGLEPAATLLDLIADESPGGIHAALDRYLARVQEPDLESGSLALLPAPGGSVRSDQPWTALTTRHAQAILTALGSRFDVVLLDTPPDLQRSSPFPAAVLADEGLPFLALVIVQPQPMERRGARQVMDFLSGHPMPHGRVRGVLIDRNRARGNAAALARSLDLEVLASIPYDKRAATAREATELVYDFDRRRLNRPARAYARLAEQIANGEGP
jgi:MinD-like ATPase involved in chromosome partitioning or flagellar assembly/fructose-specific component phosphotransferase system IIB-like protein